MFMKNIDDYRTVVISGPDDEDGLVRYFGTVLEYRYHLECLKDYLYTYYNDLAKQIVADDLRNNEDIIIYLNTLGNIVYLNSLGYGLLFIPKEITQKQIDSLYDLISNLKDKAIYIDYNLVRKHGKVVAEEIVNGDDGDNNVMLDKFLAAKPYIKKKVK